MRIVWESDAVSDLHHTYDYIHQHNPSSAKKTLLRIYDAVELLSTQPNMGRAGRISKTRELVINGIPYIIPYRIQNQTIEILRVMHTSIH